MSESILLFSVCRVPLETLLKDLNQGCIAIVLVDCKTLNSISTTDSLVDYTGHFVVLIGYSESLEKFIYLDPSRRGRCYTKNKTHYSTILSMFDTS
jgi:Guanylylate cyclase